MTSSTSRTCDLAHQLCTHLPIPPAAEPMGLLRARALLEAAGWCDQALRVLRRAQAAGVIRKDVALDRAVSVLADICAGALCAGASPRPSVWISDAVGHVSLLLEGLRQDDAVSEDADRRPLKT